MRNPKNASTSAAYFVEMCAVLQARADGSAVPQHSKPLSAPGLCSPPPRANDMQQHLACSRSNDSTSELSSFPDSEILRELAGQPESPTSVELAPDAPGPSCGHVRLPPLPYRPSAASMIGADGEASTSQAGSAANAMEAVCQATNSMMSAASMHGSLPGAEHELARVGSDRSRMALDPPASDAEGSECGSE